MTLKSQREIIPWLFRNKGSSIPAIQEPGTETLATQGALEHSMQKVEYSFHSWLFSHQCSGHAWPIQSVALEFHRRVGVQDAGLRTQDMKASWDNVTLFGSQEIALKISML